MNPRNLAALHFACIGAAAAAGQSSAPAATPKAGEAADRPPRALRSDDLKGLSWRSIGPANMGGRVAGIALAPGNSKQFFVGFGTGGLWKTDNRGVTFSPLFDKELTSSIGSIAVADAPPDWSGWAEEEAKERDSGRPAASAPATGSAPAKSLTETRREKGKARIVWVGTGEGNGRNSSSFGNGVYRSTDGGATWTHCGLADSHDIPALAVDPRNPDVCYAAALGHLWGANDERGVYKTTDGGRTWTPVLKIDKDTGCVEVVIDPVNPDTVYAGMYMRRRAPWSMVSGGKEGGIYRSDDAGKMWKKLAGGLPSQTGRIGLDIYAKDPRIVYAVVESDEGGNTMGIEDERSRRGGVFRSEDRGETWTRVSDRTPRAFYFSKVRVDPTDDQRVYLLGYTLYASNDGGRTFRAGAARQPHGDMHELVIDPADPKHLLMGTDGGIYQSWDGAATWDFHNDLAVGQFYNITLDERGEVGDGYRIGGGLQDNGSWLGVSGTEVMTEPEAPGEPGAGITNHDWRFVCWGDGYHFGFDPADANIVYAEWQGGWLVRNNLATNVRKLLTPVPKEGEPRHRFNWNTPFFVSRHGRPEDGTTLYMAGNHVFKLTRGGDFWEKISGDLSTRDINKVTTTGSEAETHGTVVSLCESELAPGMLWAGTDDGLIHVTTDDGKTWTNVTPAEVGGRYISRIEASRFDPNVAYVTVDGHRSDDMTPHAMMTRDRGRTWLDITGDLPRETGWTVVIREDLANPRVLYLGTERGAFLSIDQGGHWVRMNGETLPPAPVDDLKLHRRQRDLVAGTHGRSIWVLDDAACLSELTPEVIQKPFHLFEVRPARPKQYGYYTGFWSERPFRARNPALGANITYWLRDYDGEKVSVTIEDAKGQPVRKLTGPNAPGLNRVVWDLQRDERDRLSDPDLQLEQKQFVPPGEYTVTVTCGKQRATRTLTVLPGRWAAAARPATER